MYLGYTCNDQKDTEIKTLESLKFEGGRAFSVDCQFFTGYSFVHILLWLMN